jgi:hypothetical protein
MGNTPAGILQAINIASAGDTVTTAGASGGQATHTMTNSEVAPHTHGITDPGHSHPSAASPTAGAIEQDTNYISNTAGFTPAAAPGSNTSTSTTGISINSTGGLSPPGGQPFNVMASFVLGTWYMKL